MKKICLLLCAAALFTACNNEKAGSETSSTEMPKEEGISITGLSMPASYSSSFALGNPEYAKMIVQGSWKDWDDNNLDNMKNWVADTIVAFHSNDHMVKGLDSMMAGWKRYRALYSTVYDTINAVIPVYSTDKKENWVLVWAVSYGTMNDGTKDTAAIMETWRINKDGKADMLLQYDRAKRKK